MDCITTITSQGQLTIPKADFWSLSGALHASVVLTDAEFKQARDAFAKQWATKV